MNATPETDIRAALGEASHEAGLTFSPEAVLAEGHRVVRRRRIAAGAAVAAATAVVAVVAVQLGTGQPRALPAGDPSASQTAVAAALDESAQLYPDGSTQSSNATGVRVEIASAPGGRVHETWIVLEGFKPVKAVRREVPRPKVGESSLLLPAESGLPGVIAGWVETGTPRTVIAGPVFAPDVTMGGSGSTTRLVPAAGGPAPTRYLFVTQAEGLDPTQLAGVVWSDALDDADPTKVGYRAALTANARTDLHRAVLTTPDGTMRILWTDDKQSGLLWVPGAIQGPSGAGPLRLLLVSSKIGVEPTPDLVFGWADGTEEVRATSSDPADHVVVSTQQVDGRTAFVVAPTSAQQVKGQLTITGGGTSSTVDFATERQG
ncbi:hypothetical protein [Terracoccus sp. 273MFTsu3.1]|uniref:hypothetical protein n=1 Tax=Terracoccus sp. 273MFTsu3.1 TaxID=1172188 RepID=UPI000372B9E1|nr:hypothetical protein [Terracoccus sp. 273MFTsu3.1]